MNGSACASSSRSAALRMSIRIETSDAGAPVVATAPTTARQAQTLCRDRRKSTWAKRQRRRDRRAPGARASSIQLSINKERAKGIANRISKAKTDRDGDGFRAIFVDHRERTGAANSPGTWPRRTESG